MTSLALQTFETQKIMQIANDEQMSEEDKIRIFKESFTKLTGVNIGMVSASIFKVDSSQGSTDNQEFIKEFIDNADKNIFNKIQQHLEFLKEQNSVRPIVVPVTDALKEKGFKGDTIEVPLTFDAAAFFG
jgi:mannose/fructose/N-acetylgalactosamine-specific phosphotransferase system component IID